jgi:hypothetical protein
LKVGSSIVLAPVASTMAFSAFTVSFGDRRERDLDRVRAGDDGAAHQVSSAPFIFSRLRTPPVRLLDDALFPVLQGAASISTC